MIKYATPDGGDWTYADEAGLSFGGWATLAHLADANKAAGGHWFDRDALRFFGSTRRELLGGAVVVELQRNAPEGMGRYVAVPFGPDAHPLGVTCRHGSRDAARRCARRMLRHGFSIVAD